MNPPKIFVGTLYCGENEFEECCERIKRQTYQNFEHFIYRNLPNKEAHDALFSDFLSRNEFDILVKVDADLVIREDIFFEKVVTIFGQNPDIDLIEFVVYDFFEQVINMGLNCYRQGFTIVDKGHLFTDRITDIPKEKKMVSNYVSSTHCPNPSDYQAFHFGYHAQIKKRDISVRNTFFAYLTTFNRKRGLAICGVIEVMKGNITFGHNTNYNDPAIHKKYEEYYLYNSIPMYMYVVVQYVCFKIVEFWRRGVKFIIKLCK